MSAYYRATGAKLRSSSFTVKHFIWRDILSYLRCANIFKFVMIVTVYMLVGAHRWQKTTTDSLDYYVIIPHFPSLSFLQTPPMYLNLFSSNSWFLISLIVTYIYIWIIYNIATCMYVYTHSYFSLWTWSVLNVHATVHDHTPMH